jgi:hypothetical protein
MSTFTEYEEVAEPPTPDETFAASRTRKRTNLEEGCDPQTCPKACHVGKHSISVEQLLEKELKQSSRRGHKQQISAPNKSQVGGISATLVRIHSCPKINSIIGAGP